MNVAIMVIGGIGLFFFLLTIAIMAKLWWGITKIVFKTLVALVTIGLLAWGIYWWANQPSRPEPPRGMGTASTPVRKTLVFHWSMAPGNRTDDGYTESTFTAEITKDDGMLFWVDLYNVRGELVSYLRLRREEGKLVGRFQNRQHVDYVQCFLQPNGAGWTGTLSHPKYEPFVCWLRYQ